MERGVEKCLLDFCFCICIYFLCCISGTHVGDTRSCAMVLLVFMLCVGTCVASAVVTHAVAARDLLLVFILFAVCTCVYSFSC